jgi:peptidoglycan/xylan/chitin deacetylase (PgdA/CDA1 family)
MTAPSRRDFLKLGGTALLAAAFGSPLASDPSAGEAPVVYHGSNLLPQIAMTFDDCWHPEVLQQLMSLVQPYSAFHFTFFAIGDAIEINENLNPGIWQRLVQAGHEIGYHTYHHVDPQVMSTKNLLADFDQWTIKLNQVLGSEAAVHFARPPYDDLSRSFLELCKERALVATLYSAGFEAANMVESMRLVSRAVNGDIVQMHTYQDPPNGRFDVDISAKAVPYLAQKGFTLVSMSELYADLLREENSSAGCHVGTGSSLTRTCLD